MVRKLSWSSVFLVTLLMAMAMVLAAPATNGWAVAMTEDTYINDTTILTTNEGKWTKTAIDTTGPPIVVSVLNTNAENLKTNSKITMDTYPLVAMANKAFMVNQLKTFALANNANAATFSVFAATQMVNDQRQVHRLIWMKPVASGNGICRQVPYAMATANRYRLMTSFSSA